MTPNIVSNVVDADCVLYHMDGCFVLSCYFVHTVDFFMNEGMSAYDQVISLTCFVSLFAKQRVTFK